MKVIENAEVRDGFARRITYHIPYATREVDKLEYTGQKQIAYCGYSEKGHLREEDFSEYGSSREIPEGKYFCDDCWTGLKEQGSGDGVEQIFTGELEDPRIIDDFRQE